MTEFSSTENPPILDEAEIQRQVLELCQKLIHPSITAETRLVEEGLLDSFHTLRLVTELEAMYGVEIELSTIEIAHVQDVASIANHVLELRAASASACED